MDDGLVDLVITSPPYNMNLRIRNGEYCSRQIVDEFSTKYQDFSDNLPIEKYNSFHTKVLRELLRVSNLVFYNIQIVTGSKRSVFKMIGDFSEYLKDIIIWDKGVSQPAMQELVLNRQSELLTNFSDESSLVYDPFMGTGTTALACKMLKRNYIGSEINKTYIDISDDRLGNSGQMWIF